MTCSAAGAAAAAAAAEDDACGSGLAAAAVVALSRVRHKSPLLDASSSCSYPAYLTALLLHRDWRDDAKCAEKYKQLWTEYTTAVPWRIMPGVY